MGEQCEQADVAVIIVDRYVFQFTGYWFSSHKIPNKNNESYIIPPPETINSEMAPLLCQILILSALAIRGSAFEWIAGYEPYTRVSDHAAIDLDQQTIDGLLKLGSIESVKGIYENGGYSQSIAKLQILNSVNLTGTTVPSGTQVMGRSTSGIQIFALLMHDLSFSSNSSEELEALVQYPSKSLANELNCRMGGLISINSEAKSGCKFSNCFFRGPTLFVPLH